MSGVVNPYDGSILFERVLKANLPTKTSGKKIFFVVNKPTDTVGEIWATNNEGTVVCYSVAVDVQTLNSAMADFQKQLANLTEADTSLLNKINVLSNQKADKHYTNLESIGLSDADMSATDLGANIRRILDAMPNYSTLKLYASVTSMPNLAKSIQSNSVSKVTENFIKIEKWTNTNVPNRVEVEPNRTNGTNTLEIGWYDNVWSGLRKASNEVTYINSGTHTLSDYMQEGTYCFGSGCAFTDIPAGSNGWLIVLPSNREGSNRYVKQIWMRWGTATTNSWQTFERVVFVINGVLTVGEWTQYATTTKTDIPLPYNTGYEDINTSTEKSKISVTNNIVTITLNLKKVDGSNFNADEIFAVIPSSYRPALLTRFDLSCYGSSIGWDKLTGFVFSNGNTGIKIPKNVIAKNIYGTVTYQI